MITKVEVSQQFHQVNSSLEIVVETKDGKCYISMEKGQYIDYEDIYYQETVEISLSDWEKLVKIIESNDLLNWKPIRGEVKHAQNSFGFSIYGSKMSKYSFDYPPDNIEPVSIMRDYIIDLADKKLNLKYSEGLARFNFNGLYGYMNSIGVICIKPKYLSADNFSNNKAKVSLPIKRFFIFKGKKDIWIDKSGNIIK